MITATVPTPTSPVETPTPAAPLPRHYYRTLFTVYWMDASPSTEIFYLVGPTHFTPASISAMEQFILALMQDWYSTRALSAIYLTHGAVEMSPADIAKADWRVIDTMMPPDARPTVPPTWNRAPV